MLARHEHKDHDKHDHDKHDHDKHDHDEHDHDEHDHAGIPDPHIWLDPILVKTQASTIAKALIEAFPENRALYETNLDNFHTRLDTLDATFKGLFANLNSRKFMIFHPTFGYFARRYNLEQIPIEIEGKDPKPAQLAQLINSAKEAKIRFVFVAPQFSTKSAKIVANEIGGEVATLDGLAYNWEEELHKNANILAKTLR